MKEAITKALNIAYTEGRSFITDKEYDEIVNHNEYLAKTKNPKSNREHRQHIEPIKGVFRGRGDLNEPLVFTRHEFKNGKIKYHTSENQNILSLKLDGIFCSAYYDKEGKLVYCLTKYDQVVGVDVTKKLVMFGLPEQITYVDHPKLNYFKSHGVVINFELCLPEAVTFTLPEGKSHNHLHILTGLICRVKINDFLKEIYHEVYEHKAMIVHNVYAPFEQVVARDGTITIEDKLNYAKALGFKTILDLPYTKVDKILGLEHLAQLIRELLLKNDRFNQKYHIDGLMLINNDPLSKQLRNLSLHPTYKNEMSTTHFAIKFRGELYNRKVIDVIVTTSDKGFDTYSVTFAPILLNGKKFVKAKIGTLNRVKEFDIKPGSTVTIEIMSELIPSVSGVFNSEGVYVPLPKRVIR